MSTPISIIPGTLRVRRKRQRVEATPNAPALSLVSAAYDADEQTLTLQFDRAVDLAAYDPTQITVNDGEEMAHTFDGEGGASLPDPATVRISLTILGESTAPGVTMNASSASGIVASNDGGTWAGVTDLGLPFP